MRRMNRGATNVALYCRSRRIFHCCYSCCRRPTSRASCSRRRSCCGSHRSGNHMQGSLLGRLRNCGLERVLCIVPLHFPLLCRRGRSAVLGLYLHQCFPTFRITRNDRTKHFCARASSRGRYSAMLIAASCQHSGRGQLLASAACILAGQKSSNPQGQGPCGRRRLSRIGPSPGLSHLRQARHVPYRH